MTHEMMDAGARLLPIRGPDVDRLRTMYPFFRLKSSRPARHREVDEPVNTLSVDVVLLTRAGLDDAVVRRLTEGLFRMLPQLSAELPFLKGMTPNVRPPRPCRSTRVRRSTTAERSCGDEPAPARAHRRTVDLARRVDLRRSVRARMVRVSSHRPVAAQRRLLADHRGREAADLLTRALTRDMSGVQTSILPSPEQNRHAFDPPYDANDLVALAFARYPYPEFFGWTPSSGGTVMFARTDRLPAWISAHERADVYPVEVRRDPPELEALRRRVEADIADRRRYSVFDTSIGARVIK